jgi:hypothetical protein
MERIKSLNFLSENFIAKKGATVGAIPPTKNIRKKNAFWKISELSCLIKTKIHQAIQVIANVINVNNTIFFFSIFIFVVSRLD